MKFIFQMSWAWRATEKKKNFQYENMKIIFVDHAWVHAMSKKFILLFIYFPIITIALSHSRPFSYTLVQSRVESSRGTAENVVILRL